MGQEAGRTPGTIEGETKNRVKDVLNYRRPASWIILVFIVSFFAITALLMTGLSRKRTLSVKINEGILIASDLPGAGWCYKLSQHDVDVLEEVVSSSSIMNADRFRKMIEGSEGPSFALFLNLCDSQEDDMPVDLSNSKCRLFICYYEDLNLSVIEDAAKGKSEAAYYVAEGKAAAALYGRWSSGAYYCEPEFLRVVCRKDGFSIEASYSRKEREEYRTEEYTNPGNTLLPEILALFSSSQLKQVSVAATVPNQEKERAALEAMNSLVVDVDVWLEGLRISADADVIRHAATLHLIDCDLSSAKAGFLNVPELHITACPGLDWRGFRAADMVQVLYIDIPDDCSPEEAKRSGFYPEDYSVFSEHPGLKSIAFVVPVYGVDIPGQSKSIRLTSEEGNIPEELESWLPYQITEMRSFLNDAQRVIWIIWDVLE